MNALMSPKAQLYLAWVLLIGSAIGWPASAMTVASDEPQFVLGLSWLAIILGSWNTIITTQVNKDVQGEMALSPQIAEQITIAVAQGYVRGASMMGAAPSAKEA